MKPSQHKKNYKKMGFFILRLAITFTILAYLIKKMDFHYIASKLLHANLIYIILAIILAMVSYVIMAYRWRLVIKALNHTTLKKSISVKFVMIGLFFNQFMLASVGGDAIRIWLATRHKITTRIAFNSVLFDRLFGLLFLTFLIAICMPIYLPALPNTLSFVSLSLLVISVFGGMFLLLCMDKMPLLNRIDIFQKMLGTLSKDARIVFLSYKNAWKPTVYAGIATSMPSLIVYLIGQAYHFPIPLLHCLAIIPPVILISMLPISIAGWGVREAGMVVAAVYLGITASQAILVSVCLGIIMLIASLPGAVLWLLRKETREEIKTDVASP